MSVVPAPTTTFVGGRDGAWKVRSVEAVIGPTLAPVPRVAVVVGTSDDPAPGGWALRGRASNLRYTRRSEHDTLATQQAELGRPGSTRAALIPITKSGAWWALAQDERRELFEERSHHIGIGAQYLPAIARNLYHGRDLGEAFDFLTWFEYAPQDTARFEELVSRLRATAEWTYLEREVDIRLER